MATAKKILFHPDRTFTILGNQNAGAIGSYNSSRGYLLARYDLTGNLVWQNFIPSDPSVPTNYMYSSDMITALDGGLITVGDSTLITGMSTNPNYLLINKLDNNGNRIWSKAYLSPVANTFGYDIKVQTNPANSQYYVSDYLRFHRYNASGDSVFNGSGDVSGRFAMYNNNGTASFGGVINRQLNFTDSNCSAFYYRSLLPNTKYCDLALTADSNWLAIGIKPFSNSSFRLALTKLTYNGDIVWSRIFPYNSLVDDATITLHGSEYYITASDKHCLNTDTPAHCYGMTSAVIIRTDTAGYETGHIFIQGDSSQLDSVKSNFGLQSVFDGDTIYTLGTAQVLDVSWLLWESQLKSRVAVWKHTISDFTTLNVEKPFTAGMSVYPVPADGVIHVGNLPRAALSTIKLTDLSGREVAFTVGDLPETELDTRSVTDGFYILTVQNGTDISRRKILIQHK